MSEISGKYYPVKKPEIVATMQADYSAKIQKNTEDGMRAFSTGEYKPFQGRVRTVESNIFDIMLELEDSSKKEIAEKIIIPLEQLALKYQIPAIFAGKGDLDSHMALEVGVLKNFSSEQISAVFKQFLSDKSHLHKISRIFNGLVFQMDTLIIGPNSLICSSKFNEEQGAPYKARKAIERIMERSAKTVGLGLDGINMGSFAPPYRYDDIFYSSISRLTGMASKESLTAYAQEAYVTIGENLKLHPVSVVVSDVFKGTAAEYIDKYTPHLLH